MGELLRSLEQHSGAMKKKRKSTRLAELAEQQRRQQVVLIQRRRKRLLADGRRELAAFLSHARQWFNGSRWNIEDARLAGKIRDIRQATDALVGNLSNAMLTEMLAIRRDAFAHGAEAAHRNGCALTGEKPSARGLRIVMRESEAFEPAGDMPIDEPPFPEPDHRRWVARVLVTEDDGRVWVMSGSQHGAEPIADELPGGGLEPDEDFQHAAVREVLEETGLLVELTAFVADFADETTYARYYAARRLGGVPTTIDADNDRPVAVRLVRPEDAALSVFDRGAVDQYIQQRLESA